VCLPCHAGHSPETDAALQQLGTGTLCCDSTVLQLKWGIGEIELSAGTFVCRALNVIPIYEESPASGPEYSLFPGASWASSTATGREQKPRHSPGGDGQVEAVSQRILPAL